jgi:hypothetical protein
VDPSARSDIADKTTIMQWGGDFFSKFQSGTESSYPVPKSGILDSKIGGHGELYIAFFFETQFFPNGKSREPVDLVESSFFFPLPLKSATEGPVRQET